MNNNNNSRQDYLDYLATFVAAEQGTPVKDGERSKTDANWYTNFDPNVSVRPPMTRKDYEFFRPDEMIPVGTSQEAYRKIMNLCNSAYERIGVIRSVIDLMSEFTVKGIEIIHEDEEPARFYKAWQKRVKLEDRAERFASSLYRRGQTVVRRKFGQLDVSEIRKMRRSNAEDLKNTNQFGRIPLEYVFYDPATIEIVGGLLGSMSSKKIYALRLPTRNLTAIATPKTDLERQAFEQLPQEIKDAILGRNNIKITGTHYLLKIPEDKIYVAFYKKDDSEIWAKSFIYSILQDVFYNDKLHLAKTAALDSWTNVIRLWKIGDHKEQLYMSPTQRARLASILQHNTGGGGMDLIWGSDIELEEFYPPIERLANLDQNYNGILMGLGISDVLVGGQTGSMQGGNIIGLKNLVTRIACGRRAIKDWIESEIDIIQANMKFKKRPFVRFTYEDLHDERTYFNLLVQLLDRNVISDRTVLERINEIPEVESQRITQEEQARANDTKPEKASPFHNPTLPEQRTHELKKIKLQEELKNKGDPATRTDNLSKTNKNKKSNNGRPPGSKDNVKRSRGPNKVRSPVAKVILYAENAYSEISRILTNNLLAELNLPDVRSLNSDQKQQLDKSKMYMFAQIPPFTEINEVVLGEYIEDKTNNYEEYLTIYNNILSTVSMEKLTEDQKRTLRVQSYLELWCINISDTDENLST